MEVRRLSDLNSEELLHRLSTSTKKKNIAEGAKVLCMHDVDGECFLEMEDEEFGEIGLSFGMKKSLLRFREKLLQQEQGPGSAPEPVKYTTIEQQEQTTRQWQEDEDSSDLFSPPLPQAVIGEEGVYEDFFSGCSFNLQKEIGENNWSSVSCHTSEFDEKKREVTPITKVHTEESGTSLKLSSFAKRTIVKKRNLPELQFYSIIKWEEEGKPRTARDFMKLRDEEIVLEGWLQKLAGLNSWFQVNHWKSRYAFILKSGIFINFERHNRKLYQKGVFNFKTIENIQIQQTTSEGSSLRIEIFTSKKRLVLGFSSQAEMLMWRDEILRTCEKSN